MPLLHGRGNFWKKSLINEILRDVHVAIDPRANDAALSERYEWLIPQHCTCPLSMFSYQRNECFKDTRAGESIRCGSRTAAARLFSLAPLAFHPPGTFLGLVNDADNVPPQCFH